MRMDHSFMKKLLFKTFDQPLTINNEHLTGRFKIKNKYSSSLGMRYTLINMSEKYLTDNEPSLIYIPLDYN